MIRMTLKGRLSRSLRITLIKSRLFIRKTMARLAGQPPDRLSLNKMSQSVEIFSVETKQWVLSRRPTSIRSHRQSTVDLISSIVNVAIRQLRSLSISSPSLDLLIWAREVEQRLLQRKRTSLWIISINRRLNMGGKAHGIIKVRLKNSSIMREHLVEMPMTSNAARKSNTSSILQLVKISQASPPQMKAMSLTTPPSTL